MYEVEMFFGIVFICSTEYLVCFCAASLIGEVVSKETKWSYENVEKAARITQEEFHFGARKPVLPVKLLLFKNFFLNLFFNLYKYFTND